jgi:nucleoside phosphorylase
LHIRAHGDQLRVHQARQVQRIDDSPSTSEMIDAVFVPRGAEERAVRAGLRSPHFSRKQRESSITIHPTGIGPSSSAAAEAVIANGVPSRVLVTGLCGSLDAQFRPGDVLLYASAQNAEGIPLSTDSELTAAVQQAIPSAMSGIRALSVDHIIARATEKRTLAEHSGCQAIDMESLTLLARLQSAGASVAVLRVVSDGAGDDLPDLNAALDASGNLDPKRIAGACLFSPLATLRMSIAAIHALRVMRSCFRSLSAGCLR